MSMVDEALNYSKRGWYVFPCREKPGSPFVRNGETVTPTEKTPYVAKGLNSATLDEDQIRSWWKMWENALIGVNAGKSGLFVVDIDRKQVNGLDTFTSWNINDSAGLQSITPSGGMHIVFSGSGKSSTNPKTGIDTRGEGGYFIAPPSKIVEGDYCGEYKTFNDWSKPPGIIPDGLMGKLFPNETREYVRGNTISYDGEKKQLSRATLTFLADGAMEGERNSVLFKVLADFSGCGYSQEHTREAVMPVCVRIGLSSGEFETVLEHAYSKPRTASIPDSIQEKIMAGGKDVASRITPDEEVAIEEGLIACMIVENELIPIVKDILYFDDFQSLKNRYIFKAINRLHSSGMKVDYITLSSEITKETSKITLEKFSTMLSDYFIDTANAMSYALIIKEKSSTRKLESVFDNKSKYLRLGLIDGIGALEKDVTDISIEGGIRSTSVLDSKQATDMVVERTTKLINGEITLLKTGFIKYDNEVGGFFPEELLIIAGRAGDGKSAMSLSICNNVCFVQNKAALFFTLEMSTHETICRLVCQLTGIPFDIVYTGKMNPPQWKQYNVAIKKIATSKLLFDDTFGISIPELRSKIRKAQSKGIELIVIDQLEQISGNRSTAPHLRLDEISYDIRNMAREFGIPIILNHQQNRGVTDRKLKNVDPILSDLNQAGEKPATQVWFIQHIKDEDGNILRSRIVMSKNRNGPKINFPVTFVGERMLFGNPTTQEEEDDFKKDNILDDYED